MKTVSDKIFNLAYVPQSAGDLIQFVVADLDTTYFKVRMWRGQRDKNWPLHSTAYRRLALHKHSVSEQSIQFYEKRLLERATHKGFRQRDNRRLSDLELLALLRHYGAATRLIDFTRSVLIGLWFAAQDLGNNDGALLGIHCDYLGGDEESSNDNCYEEIFKGLDKLNHPQTWTPTSVSPRVAAQHSQFLYSTVKQSLIGSLALPEDDGVLACIIVPASMKADVRKVLKETFDIHDEALFPDIEGFGYANSAIFDQYKSSRW